MSDEKKPEYNKDMILADLDAFRTGEEKDAFTVTPEGRRIIEDLDNISELFSSARPESEKISGSVDDIVLGHIKQKSREIRREHKVVRLFPRYRWAAAALMGVLVCAVSYNIFYKNEKSLNNFLKYDKKSALVESSEELNGRITPAVNNTLAVKPILVSVDRVRKKMTPERETVKSPAGIAPDEKLKTVSEGMTKDMDGNGRVDIIDAYLMDRRLMSGTVIPKKLDLNGDGTVNREDVSVIVKTAVALGRGEV